MTGEQWHIEFGLAEHSALFFATKAELKSALPEAPPAHVTRRAFDLLELDGVLCTDSAPLVYFKQVNRIDNDEISTLHRTFWNHGGAPILALIAPDEVHIYSGYVRPASDIESSPRIPAFVKTLERASSELREFLPAVESGEFLRRHKKSFDPSHRVDRDLLNNLRETRGKLLDLSAGEMDENVLDALLCRLVFTCYLFDRHVITNNYLKEIGLPEAQHLRDLLGLQPRKKAKEHLYRLFKQLGKDFNGDLFSDDLESEARYVSASHIESLYEFFRGTDTVTGHVHSGPTISPPFPSRQSAQSMNSSSKRQNRAKARSTRRDSWPNSFLTLH